MIVSIIVPSYNHASYLPITLAAVLAQTWTDWELVIVDDCSSDASVEYLRSLSEPRIRVHGNPENIGTYATLNRGLDLAEGEYIAILNSDDLWAPTKLELQVSALIANPELAISYTAPVQVLGDGSLREPQDHHWDWPRDPVQSLLCREIEVNRVLASSIIFRKGAIRFDPNYRYSGDWIAMLEMSRRGLFQFVDEPLTMWRIHSKNAHQQNYPILLEEIAVRRSILEAGQHWFTDSCDHAILREVLDKSTLKLHALLTMAGDKKLASEVLALAVKNGASNPTIQKRRSCAWMPLGLQRSRIWPGTDCRKFEQAYQKLGTPTVHEFSI